MNFMGDMSEMFVSAALKSIGLSQEKAQLLVKDIFSRINDVKNQFDALDKKLDLIMEEVKNGRTTEPEPEPEPEPGAGLENAVNGNKEHVS